MSKNDAQTDQVFGFFNEIGIIHQLSTAILAKTLPNGVHPSHFAIMNHLTRMGDNKPPAQIAVAMQVSKNTMTHSLKILSDHGYLEVHPDPEDGRGKRVHLTEAGRLFRDDAIARVTELIQQNFDADHIDTMRKISDDLAMIRQHLDKNR